MAVTLSRMSEELGLGGRTSPRVDQTEEGEREVVSLRVLEPTAAVPSAAPVAPVTVVAVWDRWLLLTGLELSVPMGLDGDRVCAPACGEVCLPGMEGGGGDVPGEALSVTGETELMISRPLLVAGP